MAVTMRIWRCPKCKVGVRAAHRPPADDICRLCMRCTRKKGRLVFRVLVVRESQKRAKVARRRETTPAKPAVGKRLQIGKKAAADLFNLQWAD